MLWPDHKAYFIAVQQLIHFSSFSGSLCLSLQYLTKKIKRGEWPQLKDLTIVGDDMTKWRFKLCNFDSDLEGGRNLNDDLNVSVSTILQALLCCI